MRKVNFNSFNNTTGKDDGIELKQEQQAQPRPKFNAYKSILSKHIQVADKLKGNE